MRRREFIMRLGGAATIWPLAAHAQQPVKVPRIGFLVTAPFDTPEFRQARDPFLHGMRELGYVEGQNFRVEYGRRRASRSASQAWPSTSSG